MPLDAVLLPDTVTVAASPLAVTRLSLRGFRNHADTALDLAPGPIVILGENGAGKTNLLEALSLLVPGKGLRGADGAELQTRESDRPWAVAATVEGPSGTVEIATGALPDGGGRQVLIDGRRAKSQAALSAHLSAVWLTPAMDRLFADAPAGRRRFLDRLVFALDPAHAARVSRHDKTRAERLRLLRDGITDTAWHGALEAVLAETGVEIAAARRDLVRQLNRRAAEETSGFPRVALTLTGRLEQALDGADMAELAARQRAALAEARRQGHDGDGPHRGDFAARDLDRGLDAAQASTGEQKAMLIALVLAHARLLADVRGFVPVLLLDELAAHLDMPRRAALAGALAANGAQCFMTGSEPGLFEPWRAAARFIHVSDGHARPADPA